MNSLNKFIRTKHTVTALLFFLIIYTIYKSSSLIFGIQNLYEMVMNIPITILKYSLSACIVIFLIKAKWVTPNVLSLKNTGKALFQCGLVLVIILAMFTQTVISKKPTMSEIEIIKYILGLLAVGVFEEFFFRLGILHILLNKWHTTSTDIKLVCFLTGCIFGAVHMGNLSLKGLTLSYVLTQVIFAIGFGSFESAVYLRSKNIWGLVIVHSLNDASIYANGRYNMKGMPIGTTSGLILFLFAVAMCLLFWLLLTRFILRKKKINEILINLNNTDKQNN